MTLRRLHDCDHCRHFVLAEAAELEQLEKTLAGLGGLLEQVRTARGLSMRAAATEIGVSYMTVSRLEGGQSRAEMSVALKVLAWLQGPEAGDQA